MFFFFSQLLSSKVFRHHLGLYRATLRDCIIYLFPSADSKQVQGHLGVTVLPLLLKSPMVSRVLRPLFILGGRGTSTAPLQILAPALTTTVKVQGSSPKLTHLKRVGF